MSIFKFCFHTIFLKISMIVVHNHKFQDKLTDVEILTLYPFFLFSPQIKEEIILFLISKDFLQWQFRFLQIFEVLS